VVKETTRSTCGFCQIGCGILVHREGGTILGIEGDPENPLNRGALCPKGRASLDVLHHPDRLRRPMKRVGRRGGADWEPIPWEEALDRTAEGLERARKKTGAPSVVFVNGSFKGGYQGQYLSRFANLFGSPNILGTGYVCFLPRAKASVATYGVYAVPDLEESPEAVVLWGANPAETLHHVHSRMTEAVARGARLMVIDPARTEEAGRADLWLRPRPGTDLALALGMLHVLVEEGRFDGDFVEQWSVGFEALRAHVRAWTPEAASRVTRVPPDEIRAAARFYGGHRPACLIWGNALDHGVNNYQTCRALCILRAVTGNLDRAGGEACWSPPPVRGHLLGADAASLTLPDRIPPEVRAQRIAGPDPMLPEVFYALPPQVLRAVRTGDPYPVRAAYVAGCNPLLTYPNPQEAREALLALDFLAVADRFLTPTAALADIVLPASTHFEHDGIVAPPYALQVALVQQEVTRVGRCRSDYEILQDLAVRLGIGDGFWETEQACLDFILEPAGVSFDAFRRIGVLHGRKRSGACRKEGFATPSGKVELVSRRLAGAGFDPLPTFREPVPAGQGPDSPGSRYPLVLTSMKRACYRHSEGRQVGPLRHVHPEPECRLHPQTAGERGIREGDPVIVESAHGAVRQRAVLDPDLDPAVLLVDYGWWYPEIPPGAPESWAASNLNVLIGPDTPCSREMGTPNLRGVACNVRLDEDP
jgi:anaerobic selenocysteine-containing dehydrogenase